MSDKHVLGFRLTFLRHFWDFLMIYALLSQDFNVEIYALFPQFFCGWKADSANFAFRIHYRVSLKKALLWFLLYWRLWYDPKGYISVKNIVKHPFFYWTYFFETALCDGRLYGYFRLRSCGIHLPSQWITFTTGNFEQSLTVLGPPWVCQNGIKMPNGQLG